MADTRQAYDRAEWFGLCWLAGVPLEHVQGHCETTTQQLQAASIYMRRDTLMLTECPYELMQKP